MASVLTDIMISTSAFFTSFLHLFSSFCSPSIFVSEFKVSLFRRQTLGLAFYLKISAPDGSALSSCIRCHYRHGLGSAMSLFVSHLPLFSCSSVPTFLLSFVLIKYFSVYVYTVRCVKWALAKGVEPETRVAGRPQLSTTWAVVSTRHGDSWSRAQGRWPPRTVGGARGAGRRAWLEPRVASRSGPRSLSPLWTPESVPGSDSRLPHAVTVEAREFRFPPPHKQRRIYLRTF